jgi:hypothetical protein
LDIDELINVLKDKATKHRQYYHYTSLESVRAIINSGYMLCTSAISENLNNQHESVTYGTRDSQEKIYFTSFTFGSNENIALWHMYAGKEYVKGLRIGIQKTSMRRWIFDDTPLIYSYDDSTGCIGKAIQPALMPNLCRRFAAEWRK